MRPRARPEARTSGEIARTSTINSLRVPPPYTGLALEDSTLRESHISLVFSGPKALGQAIAGPWMVRVRNLLLMLGVAALPSSALASPIAVTISPAVPGVEDELALETMLQWNTGGYAATGSTVHFTSGFQFEVEISVDSPPPGSLVSQAITSDTHVIDLGQLPAGTYSYTVSEYDFPGGTAPSTFAGSLSGGFTVVPEPSSFALALFGLSGLALGRHGKRAV